MSVDRARANAIAKAEVERRGWYWSEPVIIRRKRRWVVCGPVVWEVRTNTEARGMNARVVIAADGTIVEAAWLPR